MPTGHYQNHSVTKRYRIDGESLVLAHIARGSGAHSEVIGEWKRAGRIDPECFAAAYRIIAETDMEEDLPNVNARALVMTGDFDRVNSYIADVMADRIPDSPLVIFEASRHNSPTENPTVLAHTIRTCLDS